MVGFQILLAVHIFGGGMALVTGPVAMLSRKGGRLHRRAGWGFAGALAVSSAAGGVLAGVVRDRLLMTIAVLTGYLLFTGLRAVRFRRGVIPGRVDSAAGLLLGSFSLWLLASSALPADATGLFFGTGGLVLVARQAQLQRMVRPDWLLAHIAGLGGAYLATATAFLVVNLTFLPKTVVFIGPTVIGSLLITWASLRYRRVRAPSFMAEQG